MKPLSPAVREKKRYLLIRGNNLRENIEKAIFDFVGVLGMSKIGLKWIKYQGDYAIISINRDSVNETRAGLCIWPEKLIVERVSGTLKGLKKK